jgi:hypothetical protein
LARLPHDTPMEPRRCREPTLSSAAAALAATLVLLAAPSSYSQTDEVVVEAQREAILKQAHVFVQKVTGSAWASDSGEHLLGMWRIPICPVVAGLTHPQGQVVFDRLTEVASTAGAHLGTTGCRPNLYVVVTTRPEELLNAWRKRDRRMFGNSMPATVRRFLYKPLPVRVWYNTVLAGENGDMANNGGSAGVSASMGSAGAGTESMGGASAGTNTLLLDLPTFQGGAGSRLGSRLSIGAAHDLAAVIAIVDFKQMEGLSWRQIADYIAMTALTNVDPDAHFDNTPSILALFSSAPATRPQGLTEFDSTYLSALYHTDRMSTQQRILIVQKMAHDIDPAKVAATAH